MKQAHIKIKKLHHNALIPKYQSAQAAGFDLHAIEDCSIRAGERALIGTGLAFEIESNFEVQVRPRSGLALKNGIIQATFEEVQELNESERGEKGFGSSGISK